MVSQELYMPYMLHIIESDFIIKIFCHTFIYIVSFGGGETHGILSLNSGYLLWGFFECQSKLKSNTR